MKDYSYLLKKGPETEAMKLEAMAVITTIAVLFDIAALFITW